jgi:uncharacterized protein YebE (UPF0316 family)
LRVIVRTGKVFGLVQRMSLSYERRLVRGIVPGLGGRGVDGYGFLLQMPWLPLFIFVAEVCVVTLSTLRTIFISRGMKYLAPTLGFFEVLTWLFAIGQVMKNISDFRCSLAFAGGFTLGTFLGILIEERLALGSVVVRAVTHKDASPLMHDLRTAQYGVTCLPGQGATGPVQVLLTVVPRRELPGVVAILKHFDPEVFYSVDDLQSTKAGVAPRRRIAALVPPSLWPSFRVFERA